MIGERIALVLVDDDEQILVIVSQYLSFSGFDVHTFNNPLTALEFIREHQPRVVISDVRMEPINGFEFSKQINGLPSPPQVILMTGYYQREFEALAEASGVAKILEKPVRGDDLVQIVRQLIYP